MVRKVCIYNTHPLTTGMQKVPSVSQQKACQHVAYQSYIVGSVYVENNMDVNSRSDKVLNVTVLCLFQFKLVHINQL